MMHIRILPFVLISLCFSIYAMEQSRAKIALISVYDKTGIEKIAQHLLYNGYGTILSSGGTCAYLKKNLDECYHSKIQEVSDYTGFPEILDGRVKTLNPKIYAGILAKRDNPEHMQTLAGRNINPISLVIANLYPFGKVIQKEGTTEEIALENIDIGGVSLIRGAAKNYKDVCVITDPADYNLIIGNEIDEKKRRELSVKAFMHTMNYDKDIARYLSGDKIVTRTYIKEANLKYGLNPHQKPAALYRISGHNFPYTVLHGECGYINVLDMNNAWCIAIEGKRALEIPCAASIKHNSPAGVGSGHELSPILQKIFGVEGQELSAVACAYLRARNCDAMSSFGDFISISDEVDTVTAELIGKEVSDGIIAPGYTVQALEILKKKKGGKYLIVQAKPNYLPDADLEFREVNGIALSQPINNAAINADLFNNRVTAEKHIPEAKLHDLILATIALKYTASNSITYAKDGQVFAGAGQQNRVECVKLAGEKLKKAYLRQHPKAMSLWSLFKPEVKKTERINAIVHYLEGGTVNNELVIHMPETLTQEEKNAFVKGLSGVVLSSDAFFPFSDSIEVAAKNGVQYIAQTGGSIQDNNVIEACNKHGMVMAHTGLRLFTH